MVCSSTKDASVAVADGKARIDDTRFVTVPPPMSHTKLTLPAVYKHASYWTIPTKAEDNANYCSALVVLSEGLRDGTAVEE